MIQIGTATEFNQGPDYHRCVDVASFLMRTFWAEREEVNSIQTGAVENGLEKLWMSGVLAVQASSEEKLDIWYVPSRLSNLSVIEGKDNDGWSENIRKKQISAYRSTEGAIFKFPIEGSQEYLDVFITDWSPSPAACAVAIHRNHQLAATLAKDEPPCFTGRYVRHPLTGDLLPVWIADWVKANFGTGAVLVNPAHDITDLNFGRAIGLPIRFCLVPENFDGTPATWPDPPIIKMGKTIRTGFFDGQPFYDATGKYFDMLKDFGLAERYIDHQAGTWKIAVLKKAKSGLIGLCEKCNAFLGPRTNEPKCKHCDGNIVRMIPEQCDMLAFVSSLHTGYKTYIVFPAGEQDKGLLLLRLLYFDLHGCPLNPTATYLVQKVVESKVTSSSSITRIAALVGARIDENVVLRQQVLEQLQRFVDVHNEFLTINYSENISEVRSGTLWKMAINVKAAVLLGDPAMAFNYLYSLQKQLRQIPADQRNTLSAFRWYFTVTHILTGLPYPESLNIRDIWSQIVKKEALHEQDN